MLCCAAISLLSLPAQSVEDDLELLASVLRIILLLSSNASKLHTFKRTFVEPSVGGLRILLDHAQRLTAVITAKADGSLTHRQARAAASGGDTSSGSPPRGANSSTSGVVLGGVIAGGGHGHGGPGGLRAESSASTVLLSVVSALLSVAKSNRALLQVFKLQHCTTVMELCSSTHKRIRRGGGHLLQRLSTLNNSKLWLHASGATPLLLKLLAERPDEFVIHTAATTLCVGLPSIIPSTTVHSQLQPTAANCNACCVNHSLPCCRV